MIDEEKDLEMQEGEPLVELTDEQGNVSYFIEDMVVEIEGKRFAVLVPVQEDDEEGGCECGCGHDGEDDDYELIARIDSDENGEDVYVDPTDEEYDAVCKALEEMDTEE